MWAGTLETFMEMVAPPDDADVHLLGQMFDHDMLSGEIFRRIYGIVYQKYFDAYNKNKKLPDPVRNFCLKFLAERQPYTVDSIAHASLPA